MAGHDGASGTMGRVRSGPREVVLAGGNVSTAVVRVGDTVRRPAGFWSQSVHALLGHLNDVGYTGAPRTLGFDELGRHVLQYVEGTCRCLSSRATIWPPYGGSAR